MTDGDYLTIFHQLIMPIAFEVRNPIETKYIYLPAMLASPIARNYPRNEQWAPSAVYGKRAPLRRKLLARKN